MMNYSSNIQEQFFAQILYVIIAKRRLPLKVTIVITLTLHVVIIYNVV